MIERELQYRPSGAAEPRPIYVRIGTPVPWGKDWECTLTIEGFDVPYSHKCHQVDSVGAMLAALSIAPIAARSLAARGGRLTWLGEEDLHFSTTQLDTTGGAPSCPVGESERTGVDDVPGGAPGGPASDAGDMEDARLESREIVQRLFRPRTGSRPKE